MRTTGLTIEQVERERRACYGRYHEDINDYDVITEPVEYEQCDCCGYYFDPDEIHRTDEGEMLCDYHYDIYLKEKREEEEMDSLFSKLDESVIKMDFHIEQLRKIS